MHAAEGVVLVQRDDHFAHHIVDIYDVRKSVDDVDGRIVIGGESAAIAGHCTRGVEGTPGYLQAGRADVVRNYSSKKGGVHVGNRVGNAVGTVAGRQHQTVPRIGHRDNGRASHAPELVSHVVPLPLVGAEEESFLLDAWAPH